MVFENHVVDVYSPEHGFTLHIYLGRAHAPDIAFHVHESRLWRMAAVTRDPQRLIDIMTRDTRDVDFGE